LLGPLPGPGYPDTHDLENLWQTLGGPDTCLAYRSLWSLLSVPNQSVPFVRSRLSPVRSLDEGSVERLINQLDDADFQRRLQARKKIRSFGELAFPLLRRRLKENLPVEVSEQIRRILESSVPVDEDTRRSLRAIQILEYIGTREASKVLETVSKGAGSSPITTAALEGLARLRGEVPKQLEDKERQ